MDSPVRSQTREGHEVWLVLSGGNGADLTVDEGAGAGVTVPRASEGVYTITITGTHPGKFKGWTPTLRAATPANLKGYTVVADTPVAYNGTTWTLPFTVFNASVTAADLIADEYLDVVIRFGAP